MPHILTRDEISIKVSYSKWNLCNPISSHELIIITFDFYMQRVKDAKESKMKKKRKRKKEGEGEGEEEEEKFQKLTDVLSLLMLFPSVACR